MYKIKNIDVKQKKFNRIALVSCDSNENYLNYFPLVHLLWNKIINIPVKLVLVANEIPAKLNKYTNDILLFKPLKNIHTAFQAQCIRLLYPALFDPEDIIIISDIDILPINKKFFQYTDEYCDKKFIVMRDAYQKQEMLGMCHNMGKAKFWSEIFNVKSLNDVKKRLTEWYHKDYKSNKSNKLWYTDQKQLYKHMKNYDKKIILKDRNTGYKSFDLKRIQNLVYFLEHENVLLEELRSCSYTNIHCNKPYHHIIKTIFNKLLPREKLYELNLLSGKYTNYQSTKEFILTYAWSSFIQRYINSYKNLKLEEYNKKDYSIVIKCESRFFFEATLINLIVNKQIDKDNLYIITTKKTHDIVLRDTQKHLNDYKIFDIHKEFKPIHKKILVINPGFLIFDNDKFNQYMNKNTLIINDDFCIQKEYKDEASCIYNLNSKSLCKEDFLKLIRKVKKVL